MRKSSSWDKVVENIFRRAGAEIIRSTNTLGLMYEIQDPSSPVHYAPVALSKKLAPVIDIASAGQRRQFKKMFRAELGRELADHEIPEASRAFMRASRRHSETATVKRSDGTTARPKKEPGPIQSVVNSETPRWLQEVRRIWGSQGYLRSPKMLQHLQRSDPAAAMMRPAWKKALAKSGKREAWLSVRDHPILWNRFRVALCGLKKRVEREKTR